MDYKEKYEKALKVAQRFYDESVAITKKGLEDIFPELKESDDEKIRKRLLDYFKSFKIANTGIRWEGLDINEVIAWLEKWRSEEEQKKEIKHACAKGVKNGANAVNEIKKLYEHKPVEWSEEDEKILNAVIRDYQANNPNYQLWGIPAGDIVKWFKSLKDRVQPKQEWSEKDIEMIDRLIRHCKKEYEELCNDRYGHQEIVSDLKRSCRERWDWLESLKNKVVPLSHWKPSEEQITNAAREWICNHESGEELFVKDAFVAGVKWFIEQSKAL